MANLIQVNSAFGQCMESIDRVRLVRAIYPELLQACAEGDGGAGGTGGRASVVRHTIACSALGNAFPTNLDRDVPQGADSPPPSQADLLRAALEDGLSEVAFGEVMDAYVERRTTH